MISRMLVMFLRIAGWNFTIANHIPVWDFSNANPVFELHLKLRTTAGCWLSVFLRMEPAWDVTDANPIPAWDATDANPIFELQSKSSSRMLFVLENEALRETSLMLILFSNYSRRRITAGWCLILEISGWDFTDVNPIFKLHSTINRRMFFLWNFCVRLHNANLIFNLHSKNNSRMFLESPMQDKIPNEGNLAKSTVHPAIWSSLALRFRKMLCFPLHPDFEHSLGVLDSTGSCTCEY